MTRQLLLAAATALALVQTSLPVHAAGVPAHITAAVADSARPAADRDRDANRKPAETLAFVGVKPGQRVAEMMPGGGYFTRLLSGVVGPKGKVYALAPPPMGSRDMGAAVRAIAADSHYSNVTVAELSVKDFKVPEPVDLVWTSQNYHDFHNMLSGDMAAFNKAVFDALKPGGIYIVLDHAAAPGSGSRDTQSLHRIDPETVKQEVLAAGFKLDKESDVLHNAADPHTANVHDGAIRGTTDQFILKFRKPG